MCLVSAGIRSPYSALEYDSARSCQSGGLDESCGVEKVLHIAKWLSLQRCSPGPLLTAFLILWRGGRTVDWGLWSCLAWTVFTVWQLLKSSLQCGSYPAVSKTCCVAECLKNTTLPRWWIAVPSVTSVAKRWWPAGFDPFMQYLYVWFFCFFPLSCDHELRIHAGTFMLVCVDTQS